MFLIHGLVQAIDFIGVNIWGSVVFVWTVFTRALPGFIWALVLVGALALLAYVTDKLGITNHLLKRSWEKILIEWNNGADPSKSKLSSRNVISYNEIRSRKRLG